MRSPIGAGAASAQTYPVKPVRVIIVFPPGGSNDVVGPMTPGEFAQRLKSDYDKYEKVVKLSGARID